MNRAVTFIVMFAFWLLWSGMFDGFHTTLGILSSGVITIWTGHLFIESHKPLTQRMNEWLRYETYTFWLLWQIILANIEVLKLAFQPKISDAISPTFVEFKSKLKGDIPKFILAQSITLTPGTVTVSLDGNCFLVHAINEKAADGVPGEMEDRIHSIYRRNQS